MKVCCSYRTELQLIQAENHWTLWGLFLSDVCCFWRVISGRLYSHHISAFLTSSFGDTSMKMYLMSLSHPIGAKWTHYWRNYRYTRRCVWTSCKNLQRSCPPVCTTFFLHYFQTLLINKHSVGGSESNAKNLFLCWYCGWFFADI